MKKYLNKSIFYQGDINLFIMFAGICTIWTFFSMMMHNEWGRFAQKSILYGYDYIETAFSLPYMIIFALLLTIAFLITVGNKRKKWRQQLADKFSRKDIRNREMILIYGLLLVFIFISIITAIIFLIQNYSWLKYTNIFTLIFISDLVKMLVLGFLGISILFLVDSFVINNMACVGLIVFLGTYFFSMSLYLLYIISQYIYVYRTALIDQVIRIVIGDMTERNYFSRFYIIMFVFLIIGIGIFILTRKLIDKIRLENMNGFFVIQFNKSVVIFMFSTFMALLSTMFIMILFDSVLILYHSSTVNFIIFIILSIVIYYILKNRNGSIMKFIKS